MSRNDLDEDVANEERSINDLVDGRGSENGGEEDEPDDWEATWEGRVATKRMRRDETQRNEMQRILKELISNCDSLRDETK